MIAEQINETLQVSSMKKVYKANFVVKTLNVSFRESTPRGRVKNILRLSIGVYDISKLRTSYGQCGQYSGHLSNRDSNAVVKSASAHGINGSDLQSTW